MRFHVHVFPTLLLALLPLVALAAPVPTGKLPASAIPQHYALDFTIDPARARFRGWTRIDVRLTEPVDTIWLHAKDLSIHHASLTSTDGRTIEPTYLEHAESGVLKLDLGRTLPAGTVELAFDYDAPFNAQLEGLYKVTVGEDHYAVTQMEPISARLAFPGFDEPRFKTPFDLTLTVPKDLVAVANTHSISERTSSDGAWKTLKFATTKPLPTYLIAFAVGPWDVVEAPPIPANDVRDHPLPLRGIAPKGKGKGLSWVLQQTPAIVKFYEEYTRQPYPFDKLDLLGAPDFAAGAMENAGLIVYRDALLVLDADSPADRYRSVFNVNAHEIAHQWYGDLVTVPWWNDIWLNEAYATWAQRKATVALKPEFHGDLEGLEARLYTMKNDSLLSARKVRQPIVDHGDIETAFDGITYQKGASVLAMFEAWVGEDTFRKGMRDYLAHHAFGSGDSDDLIESLARASGRHDAFATAMRSFLDQPGIPLVHTALTCRDGHAKLALEQSRYLPYGVLAKGDPTWRVPVCARFGRGGDTSSQCFLLDRDKRSFDVGGACPDWYLPNADARGYYRFEMDDTDLAALGRFVASLSAPEQMIYADAVASAFRRGDVGPAAVLDAMPRLAGSDQPQVATALEDAFEWIREHLADGAGRVVLDAYASGIYRPKLERLGYRRKAGEASVDTAMRSRLAAFLALEIRDPPVRDALDRQGRAALGLDGSAGVDLTRADPDLLRTALAVAVQEGGATAFDAAKAAFLETRDTTHRYDLLAALGATRDAKLAERARDFGLTADVQIGEMYNLYGAEMDEPEDRAAAWQWLTRNFDAYRARIPTFAQGYIAKTFAEGRCSAEAADELSSFLTPHIDEMVGSRRGLGQTLESIRQCSALREHQGTKALAAWIERRERAPDPARARPRS